MPPPDARDPRADFRRRLLEESLEEPDAGTCESVIELYDHDFPVLEGVLFKLFHSTVGKRRNLESANVEIRERFGEAGFRVEIQWIECNDGEWYEPKVLIVGRVEDEPFDHEQQAREVQTALLGIDEPGAITREGRVVSPSRSTLFTSKG